MYTEIKFKQNSFGARGHNQELMILVKVCKQVNQWTQMHSEFIIFWQRSLVLQKWMHNNVPDLNNCFLSMKIHFIYRFPDNQDSTLKQVTAADKYRLFGGPRCVHALSSLCMAATSSSYFSSCNMPLYRYCLHSNRLIPKVRANHKQGVCQKHVLLSMCFRHTPH